MRLSVTAEQARAAAMALPEATEQGHHGITSFRVRGKIFATMPDDQHLRVMLSESDIRAAAAENPTVYHEFHWGKRLACLVVDLAGTSLQELGEMVTEAWLRKAPASLARQLQPRIEPHE